MVVWLDMRSGNCNLSLPDSEAYMVYQRVGDHLDGGEEPYSLAGSL